MKTMERFEGQSDFAIFLRTGLRFRHQAGPDVEVKFNPWHDPDDGRFTFAGQGTNFGGAGSGTSRSDRGSGAFRRGRSGDGRGGGGGGGWGSKTAPPSAPMRRAKPKTWTGGGFTGGGGGDFGGGGATADGDWGPGSHYDITRRTARPRSDGSRGGGGFTGGGGGTGRGFGATGSDWATIEERGKREARDAQQRAARDARRIKSATVNASISAQSDPDRLHSSTKNGYRYDYNRSAQVVAVDANLRLEPGWRSRKNQAKAGGPDRRATDHGGHYVAVRFNGSHSKLNHFAQDANFNQGAYRALEDKWAAALRDGKKVHVRILPFYHGSSRRPYHLTVVWYVDARRRSQEFENERGGK